ncbi:hypothetical protein [Aeromonas sp. AE23HZ002T15]
MAGVNIVLSANTQKYLQDLENAKKQSNSKFNDMGKQAQAFGNNINSAFQSPSGAIQGLLGRLGPVGMALGGVTLALGGMTTAALTAGNAVMQTQAQMERLTKLSGLSATEMNKQAIAAKNMGIEVDQLADIMKDVNEKTGEFLSTNGGGFQDYLDTIEGKLKRSKEDFRGLGAMEVLRKVQADLDAVGANAQQQTFVLEGIASEASKLGPLLQMNEQDIERMLTGYATQRAELSQGTIDDIKRTQNNIDVLQQNFNAALTESFSELIALLGKVTKAASEFLGERADNARRSNISESYRSGDFQVGKNNSKDFLDAAEQIKKDILADSYSKPQKGTTVADRAAPALALLDQQIAKAKEFQRITEETTKAQNQRGTAGVGGDAEKQAKAVSDAAKLRQQALRSLASTEQEIAKYAYTQQLSQLDEYLKQGALTRDEYNQATLIAEQSYQDKLLEIDKKTQAEKAKVAKEAHASRMADINALKEFSTTQEDIANQELLAQRAQVEESFRLDQERGSNSVLSEQDKNNKLAAIDREFKSQEIERQNEHMNSKEEAALIQAEAEREFLRYQYENQIIDKQEFDKQVIQSDENVAIARRDLAMAQLGTISELFKNSAQLAAEGSKKQKVLFAMEKASTIASLGLNMWEAWGKETEPGWAGMAKKAAILAQYGGAIVSAGAVTLGQFHSGSDEVSSTGSYLISAGERIIQPEANRDLTRYLADKNNSGTGITINSDLVVQGDTTISDDKFTNMLAQHRDSLLQFTNLAKRESGT